MHFLKKYFELIYETFFFQIDYEKDAANLYIKYGDMHFSACKAEDILMKQKHRLIWERRHGSLPTTGGFKLD